MNNIVGIIVTVAVGILLLIVVIYGGTSAYQNSKTSNVISETSLLINNIQGAYSGSQDFTGLTNTIANQASLTPAQWNRAAGSILTSEWNSVVTVAAGTNSNANQFTVTLGDVPAYACPKLASQISALSVQVGSGTVRTPPVSFTDASNDCHSATGSSTSIIITAGQ